MDDSNNARRHHHHGGGGAAEVVAGGNTGGGGGASNGLSLSLPLTLPLPGSSVKPNASPPPPPLPPQPAGEPAGGDRAGAGGGRDDIWSQTATTTLIDAWGERYLELNRGNLKQKHWKEVAEAVNGRPSNNKQPKTDVQCKNRLDTLKKKYKVERSKIFAGGATKWPLFTKMDELIGPARKHHHHNQQPLPLPPPPPPSLRPRRHPIESSPNLLNTATSPDMTESCLNGFNGNPSPAKRRKTAAAAAENPDSSPLKELAGAILKFGEVYERIEVVKHQQMMDLEKQRMEFAKDLELQRMHLFVQTQLELAKIKHAKHGNTEHYL